VNLLLDTHVLLWWLDDDPALPPIVLDAIVSPANRVLISAASAWEAAIKAAIGKLRITGDLRASLDSRAVEDLDITIAHGLVACALPRHHTDPFDRMLIAQAQVERLTLATVDPVFHRYDVDVLNLRGAR
jgi:PIN domain nuclease of toxin-antitoxin system